MPPRKETKALDVAKGFQELEQIASWFERGDGELEEGLQKFERAMLLADALKKRLELAEHKVNDIKKRFQPD